MGPGGIFPKAKAPLTHPAKTKASLAARLDLPEDPRDVYRIWIPARRRVDVVARSGRDLRVEIWSAGTTTVLRRSENLLSRRTKRAWVANRGTRGTFAYVNVRLPPTAGSDSAAYTLSVTTGPTRR